MAQLHLWAPLRQSASDGLPTSGNMRLTHMAASVAALAVVAIATVVTMVVVDMGHDTESRLVD